MTLTHLLRQACETCPRRVAVAVEPGRALTYESWERRSTVQAHGLAVAGVRAGDRVALLFDSDQWTEYAVTYIAAQKTGAVAVPLDAALTDIELERILRDCDASAVVTGERPGRSPGQVPIISTAELEHPDGELPWPGPPERAEVLYASHPLGPPARLNRSHRDVLAVPSLISSAARPALLHSFPVGTVAGQDMLAAALWLASVRSVMLPAFEPERLCALAAAGDIGACALHPAAAEALLDSDACPQHDLSQLNTLVLASGRVSRALLLRLAAALPSAALLLVDVLGSPAGVRSVFEYDRRRPTSIGRPTGQTAVVVGDERGRPLPAGEVGRVWTNDAPTRERGYVDEHGFLYLEDVPQDLTGGSGQLTSPVSGPEVAPVAFSQQGMVWEEYFTPGSQNLPGLARRFRGPLDSRALVRALDEIIRRHAALRTTFALRDGHAVQVVHPHRPLDLPVCDLTDRPPPQREAEVQRLVAEAGRRPFDLVEGPLFDPTLLRLGDEDHVLVIRAHHTVFDDWSVSVFRRELAALYPAYAVGEPSPLPEPPVQFADFSRRRAAALAGTAGEHQMSFWRRELAGAPLITQLAVDDPNLPLGSRQPPGGPISLELSSELCDGLRELARRERATLFMTVLAAFGVLVARHTGEDDLLLATVVANRNRTELEGLIGCFTKKVPLRLRLSGDPSFGEVLSRTRSGLLGALAHQDLPFEGVVQEVLGASAASYGLVPRVPIVFQGVTPQQELALPDIETAGLETSAVARRAHFMATVPGEPADTPPDVPWGAGLYLGTFVIVSLSEVGDRLSLSARGAFHGPAVSELMRSFRTLLADIAAHPARRLSDVAVLDERGRDDALRRGLGPVACQTGDTVYALFAAQVRQAPDAIALEERGGRLTFSALAAEAERLADRLRALGVGPGERVGISLRPSAELVVAVLAVWNAGAAWVGLDPADTEDRRNWIGRDASLAVVVTDARGPDADGRVRIVTSRRKSPPADAGGYSAAPARPGDGAVVFYGSGPSAVARGVLLDQRAVLGLLEGLRDAVYSAPEEPGHPRRVCLSAGPAGDAFLRQLVALLDGHCLRVPDTPIDDDPREALALLGAGEVDLLHCTVDELQALQEAGLARVLDSREHRLTPGIIVGTRSAVGPELWHTLGRVAGARAHLLFGPPECAFGATVAAVGRSAPRGVGRSMTGIRSHILDSHGRPVPTGAVGELHLGGPSLARGYLGDPEASRTRFVELSIQGVPTRLHRTDQLARSLPDGGVELLGPLHGGEHLRGFRINHARIRSALRRAPGIRDVVLEQGSDDRGEQRLLAKVVAEGKVPTPGRLRAILWSALPGYAWPSTVVAVPGQRAATHADAVATERPPRASAAGWRPEPSWQRRMLTALWAEVLGLEEVSAQENYWQRFSFLEALARAREAGMPVPSDQVMRSRTLDTLAASLAVPPSTISGFR